jgi:hypothetical protein
VEVFGVFCSVFTVAGLLTTGAVEGLGLGFDGNGCVTAFVLVAVELGSAFVLLELVETAADGGAGVTAGTALGSSTGSSLASAGD